MCESVTEIDLELIIYQGRKGTQEIGFVSYGLRIT